MQILFLFIALIIYFSLTLGLLYFIHYQLKPILRGAPNLASQQDRLPIMLEFAKLNHKDVVIDLGSGDGEILLAVARRGVAITGIEIDPFAVKKARKKIRVEQLDKKITLIRGNFWKHDVSPYNVVFVYGINYIMKDLEKKLMKELKPGSRIISNRYEFPNLEPVKKKNFVTLYKI